VRVEATMIATKMTWTEERIALLKSWIDSGLSCGQIARELGVSRNAVIGKAHRLGLSRFKGADCERIPQQRVPRVARLRLPARRRAPLAWAAAPKLAAAEMPIELPVESANRCSFLELQQWHCRWPISEPGAVDFGFCGNEPIGGLPYCRAHARMAYRRSGGCVRKGR
jgi:GcrA cell cycle regulator